MFKPKAKHLHPVEDIPAEIAALRAVGWNQVGSITGRASTPEQ